MTNKKVSVIITTHNRHILLKRALESALKQDYHNIEVIVVDDASSVETQTVCSNYPIKYIRINESDSKGGNYARNLGVLSSTGYYCAFLDDDDYWFPDKISKQVKMMEEKGCSFVGCGIRQEIIGTNNKNTFRDKEVDSWLEGDIKKKVMLYIPTTTSTLLVKREALNSIGLWDENMKFWQDYDLMVRLAQISKFYYVHESLIVYRIDKSDTNRLTNKFFEWKINTVKFREKHTAILNQLNLFEKIIAKTLVWRDGYKRCQNSGLYSYSILYLFLCFILFTPFVIYKKIIQK